MAKWQNACKHNSLSYQTPATVLLPLQQPSGAQSGGGIEGPQEPLEALLALNKKLGFLADQDRSAPVPIDRPADFMRTSLADIRRSDGSVQPLEEELSAVSLTLVKVRQRLNIDHGPTSTEIGRLTDAIQGLEQRMAQLLEANRPEPKSAPTPLVGNAHPSSVELRQGRAARPQPAGSSTLLFDDDSFVRLVKLSKRELLAPHRKLYWTAATAAAVALILTAAGAARQWLNGASLDGPGAQPPRANYSDRVEQDRSPSEAASLTR